MVGAIMEGSLYFGSTILSFLAKLKSLSHKYERTRMGVESLMVSFILDLSMATAAKFINFVTVCLVENSKSFSSEFNTTKQAI